MLRFEMKTVLKAGLLAAVLAAPMAASAQSPFTAIIQFTETLVVGNPIVPTPPPTAPGATGIAVYVARGGNGVGPIAVPEYISAGSVRIYWNSLQLASPTAPSGDANSVQLDATGTARPSTVAPVVGAVTADAIDADGLDNQVATDFFRQVGVNFVSGGNAPLRTNAAQLPIDWTYADPNNAPGTFEPLLTLNTTVLPGATFPIAAGVTLQSAAATITTRRVDNNQTGSDTLRSNANEANTIPLSVDLTSLTASVAGDTATISWSTAAEYDNAGFVVYRADANGDQGEAISTLVAAEGSAASGASYSVVDPAALAPGESRSYILADIDLSGATTTHGPVSVTRGAASAVAGWELY